MESSIRIDKERALISSRCPLFACRYCRTKPGWQHQSWCSVSGQSELDCPDCRYWNIALSTCAHPMLKREECTAK